ncbi:Sir2 histone deacetylase Hst2 [Elasticomyces elasticus]|nr:Sir2 histone deacetylase Hst2 [Elasticomyces elasticus]
MGQDESTPVDESVPPETLESRTLDGLAKYIKEGRAKRIVVMTGAGISTSAGIPDFRSPDTGLYANLARLNLPYAEAVFDISFFRENPLPFYTLAHELYPGKYRPTVTHSFIRLLHDKGHLLKLFTQNIDCLEREAGVPGTKIIEAHGSFARQSCIECKASYPDEDMKQHIAAQTIPRCLRESCGGLVKPEIVFFGEQLPAEFFMSRGLPAQADLCIVLGTSLTVQPFASLPSMCSEGTPRLLINQEVVGGLGSRPDDVLLIGDCDTGVRRLADACGWRDELETLWANTVEKAGTDIGRPAGPTKSKDKTLEDEVEKLTREIDETLSLSKWHEEKTRKDYLAEEPIVNGAEAPAESGTSSPEGDATNKHKPATSTPRQDPKLKAEGTSEPNPPLKLHPSSGEDATPEKNGEDKKVDASDLTHVFPHLVGKASL